MYSVFPMDFIGSLFPGQRGGGTVRRALAQANPPSSSLAFVSDHGTELCVCCRQDTGIPVTRDVRLRPGFEDGVGQFCESCAFI